ncbi:MAG: flavin reductase family protein [Halobacteriota archaeon]
MSTKQQALWKLINPIAVVTGSYGGTVSGFIASWITQVSFVPPLVMVAINPLHYSYELIARSNAFAINLLRADQAELVDWFGKRSGKSVNKLSPTAYELSETGVPLLRDCLASIECAVMWMKEAGDHVIVVGTIVNAEIKSEGQTLQETRSMYTASSPTQTESKI